VVSIGKTYFVHQNPLPLDRSVW